MKDWAWQAVYDLMVEATTEAAHSHRSGPDLMDDLAIRMAQALRDEREACARWHDQQAAHWQAFAGGGQFSEMADNHRRHAAAIRARADQEQA